MQDSTNTKNSKKMIFDFENSKNFKHLNNSNNGKHLRNSEK